MVFGLLATSGPPAAVALAFGPAGRWPRRRRRCKTPGSTPISTGADRPANIAFAPQYPLWTDGAVKRRWISAAARHGDRRLRPRRLGVSGRDPVLEGVRLRRPPGRDPLHRAAGRRRLAVRRLRMERRTAARRARAEPRPARGLSASAGGRAHAIPAVSDCHVCHGSGSAPVLGFSLLQLSPDRDPGALNRRSAPRPIVDLADLVAAGLLVGLPQELLATPAADRGRDARRARRARLHARQLRALPQRGRPAAQSRPLPAPRDRRRRRSRGARRRSGSLLHKPAPGQSPEALLRVAPGDPELSALLERIGSRGAALQMPPLGTEVADAAARRADPAMDRRARRRPRRKKQGRSETMPWAEGTRRMLAAAAAALILPGAGAGAGRPGDGRQVPGRHLRVPRLPHALAHRARTGRSPT